MGFAADSPLGGWFDATFTPAFETYRSMYAIWSIPGTRTEDDIIRFRKAEKALIPLYRRLYRGFLRDNPLVTDTDLNDMGLPARSGGERPHYPAPATTVRATALLVGPGVIEIRFRDTQHSGWGKPKGIHSVEIAYVLCDAPPAGRDEFTNVSSHTRSPFRLSFLEKQRGKRLYFILRWENNRAEKGPWNEIQYIIIP
jgi:hypothetical protein